MSATSRRCGPAQRFQEETMTGVRRKEGGGRASRRETKHTLGPWGLRQDAVMGLSIWTTRLVRARHGTPAGICRHGPTWSAHNGRVCLAERSQGSTVVPPVLLPLHLVCLLESNIQSYPNHGPHITGRPGLVAPPGARVDRRHRLRAATGRRRRGRVDAGRQRGPSRNLTQTRLAPPPNTLNRPCGTIRSVPKHSY